MNVKAALRRHPRVWDRLKALSRFVTGYHDPLYRHLDRFSRHLGRPARFIQVGASDGLRNDPIREFVVRDSWTGAFVEPLPEVFELLKSNYSYLDQQLSFIRAAVATSTEPSELEFVTFTEAFLAELSLEERLSYLRKASLDLEHVMKFADDRRPEEVLRKISVPVITINEIVASHFGEADIDILILDVEGHETDIIRGLDFEVAHPEVILFESHHMGGARSDLYAYLETRGYEVMEVGGDAIAAKPRLMPVIAGASS